MANPEHEAVKSYLFKRFDLPNNGVDVDPPIEVYDHFNPTGYGNKIAPDVAICPSEVHVPRPSIPHPGPPPSNAKLWTRQALAESVLSTNLTLAGAGVHVKTWDFGTLRYGTFTPTNCISANLPAYQVTIPVLDIFWNPPIMNGVVNEVDYIPTVPHGVVGNNFLIDLYSIQRWVFKTQT
ncbi:16180_t:CDS:2 [Racocetra fulgida]|uniref:16180_t:CDS:1 n=1 Tax=Racocetra fulgida TaxID=60492 RepID=A0A9N9BCZ2_9GLOM|nr:16180_t:CDS:2 [Racocetra fulgida]